MGFDHDVLTAPGAVYDPERPAAASATGLLDTRAGRSLGARACAGSAPARYTLRAAAMRGGVPSGKDDGLAPLGLRVRDHPVA